MPRRIALSCPPAAVAAALARPAAVAAALALPAAVVAALVLGACVPSATQLDRVRLAREGTECRGSAAQQACFFLGAPVALREQPVRLKGRILTFFRTARALHFFDNQRSEWQAPANTLTDGASIPLLFVPLVGSPQTPEFRAAAALHDAYCGIGNEDGPVWHAETWPRVHRMFHDALVAGGVPAVKAKVMFAAVWLGGPRWQPKGEPQGWTPQSLPDEVLLAAMRKARAHIEHGDPPLPALILYLEGLEHEMRRAAALPQHGETPKVPVRPVSPVDPENPEDPKNPVGTGGTDGAVRGT